MSLSFRRFSLAVPVTSCIFAGWRRIHAAAIVVSLTLYFSASARIFRFSSGYSSLPRKHPFHDGIWNGLRPLLPLFDHLLTTLVADLDQRGLLDDTLVIAMGEFGRTPQMGTQDSTDGRNHWPVVMSMVMAGGGFRHGQVIGATEQDGGQIKERRVTPGDLAATIYHHMGVPLETTYLDTTGRPLNAVIDGRVIGELR